MVGIPVLDTFLKKLSISMDQEYEILYFVFTVCSSQGLPKNIETKVLSTCFYLIFGETYYHAIFYKLTKFHGMIPLI